MLTAEIFTCNKQPDLANNVPAKLTSIEVPAQHHLHELSTVAHGCQKSIGMLQEGHSRHGLSMEEIPAQLPEVPAGSKISLKP